MASKLFKRLGIALTSMALAIGVGVGLSQRGEYKETRADISLGDKLTSSNFVSGKTVVLRGGTTTAYCSSVTEDSKSGAFATSSGLNNAAQFIISGTSNSFSLYDVSNSKYVHNSSQKNFSESTTEYSEFSVDSSGYVGNSNISTNKYGYNSQSNIIRTYASPDPYASFYYITDLYTITYNNNGGSGTIANETASGSHALSNGSGFTRANYELYGWATSANGDKVYNLGETINVSADLNLYAKWRMPVTSVSLTNSNENYTPSEKVITIEKDDGSGTVLDTITASVSPNNAYDTTVTWTVSGDNVYTKTSETDTALSLNINTTASAQFVVTASADGGQNVTDTLTYRIIDPSLSPLTGVTVTGTATYATQYAGRDFNYAGLTFTSNHENGGADTEINGATIEWNKLVAGNNQTGSYTENGITVTVTVSGKVTVVSKSVSYTATDTINYDTTDWKKESGSYTDWSNKTAQTGVLFTGNNYKNTTGYLQFRSSSGSGIISTTTVGTIKEVSVTFNNSTADGRELNVYGNTSAYTATSNLYDGATDGDRLTSDSSELSFDKESGVKTYTLTLTGSNVGKYKYFGIRSEDGAIYLDSIVITWDYNVSSSDIETVDNYIDRYMHLDYDNGGTKGSAGSGDGSCVGYYGKDNNVNGAKYNFTQLTTTQKAIILNSTSVFGLVGSHEYHYNEIKDRLSEWARINGDTFNLETGAFNSANNGVVAQSISNDSSEILVAIIIIAGVSALAIGGYFFIRRRKER